MLLIRRANSRYLRATVFVAALGYLAAALHGVLPGAHGAEEHLASHSHSHDHGETIQPSPVCPHQLPAFDFDGHPDCALCKLTRSQVVPESASGLLRTQDADLSFALPRQSVPCALEYWQPLSRRGPPQLS